MIRKYEILQTEERRTEFMNVMGMLQDKTAVVTGGTRGIGRAVV